MSKASQPELKKVRRSVLPKTKPECDQFMDKKLFIHLQGGRKVSGILRGYDIFLNLVIDDALEESTPAQKHPIGTVVWLLYLSSELQAILTFSRSFEATV